MGRSNLPEGYVFEDRKEAESLKKLAREYMQYAPPDKKEECLDDAIALLKIALPLSPDDPQIRSRLGILLYKQAVNLRIGGPSRDYKLAIFYLTQAAYSEADPLVSRAYLVKALMNDRQHDRALFHAEEGVQDHPDEYHFWTCRGAMEMGSGQFEAGVFSLRNAVERLPPAGEDGPDYAMTPEKVIELYADARRMLEQQMKAMSRPPEP